MASVEQSYAWMGRYKWVIHKEEEDVSVSAALLQDCEPVGEDTLEAAKRKLVEVTKGIALEIFRIKGCERFDQITLLGPLLKGIHVNVLGKRGPSGSYAKPLAIYMLEGCRKQQTDKNEKNVSGYNYNTALSRRLRNLKSATGVTCRISLECNKGRKKQAKKLKKRTQRELEGAETLSRLSKRPHEFEGVVFNGDLDDNSQILIQSLKGGGFKVVKHDRQSEHVGKLTSLLTKLIEKLEATHQISEIRLVGKKCELEGSNITYILNTLLVKDPQSDTALQEFAEGHGLLIQCFTEDGEEAAIYADFDQYAEELGIDTQRASSNNNDGEPSPSKRAREA